MTDVTILNTRPWLQQQESNKTFSQHGFNIINFPCIEIKKSNTPHKTLKQLKNIKTNDVVIFPSQYAVHCAFQLKPDLDFEQNTIIAVGHKTAECLEKYTASSIFTPTKQNSKGVIELLKGMNKINTIQLITAPQGRTLIQEFAQLKHITLHQINVYHRALPKVSTQDVFHDIQQCCNLFILATSITTLKHLKQLLPTEFWFHIISKPLVCASERIQRRALQMGFVNTYNTNTANSEKMAQQIIELSKAL